MFEGGDRRRTPALHLTGAAVLVSRGIALLQAVPAVSLSVMRPRTGLSKTMRDQSS